MAYTYYRTVTIDHTKCGSSDSTNFPAVFVGTFTWLKTVGNGGHVQSSSGYDIIFSSNSSGSGILNFERVSWDATTGICEFWINVPTVSHTSDTVIYIVYGNAAIVADQQNATATWPGQFKAVYHLDTNTGVDSTGNNNGTSGGAGTTTVAGQIGSAQNSTAGANNIDLGSQSNIFGATSVLTISAWLYNNDVTTIADDSPIGCDGTASGSISVLWAGTVSGVPNSLEWQYTSNGFGGYQTFKSTAFTVPLNTWYHASWSLDLGTPANSKIYANGAVQASSVTPTGTPPTAFTAYTTTTSRLFAGYGNIIYAYTGSIDEVRYSNTIPSADWVLTEFNNQSSPSTFYTVGAEIGSAVSGGGQAGAFLVGL